MYILISLLYLRQATRLDSALRALTVKLHLCLPGGRGHGQISWSAAKRTRLSSNLWSTWGTVGHSDLDHHSQKKTNENWVFHRDRVSVFPDKYWGPYWGLSKAFHEPSLNQICWTATLSLMKYIYIQYIYTLPSCFEAPYVFMNDYITL